MLNWKQTVTMLNHEEGSLWRPSKSRMKCGLLLRRFIAGIRDRDDFTVAEIVAQAEAENATGTKPLRPGVQIHAYLHCVANRKPNPARLRMLTETSRGRRRLYRPGDPCHPDRRSGKHAPDPNEVPPVYGELIDWYRRDYAGFEKHRSTDPILSLLGLGKEIWADEDADAYVRRLREGWE